MTKGKSSSNSSSRRESKVTRPGIHAKTKTSNHKRSKNYRKSYRGQGK